MYPEPHSRGDGDPASAARLRAPVARALLESALPIEPAPGADWTPTTHLLEPGTWAEMGARYSAALGTPHLAPGILCALQHYAGRHLGTTVAAWVADGSVLDPDHRRWWAHLDAGAATLAVACPGFPIRAADTDPAALAAAVTEHLHPMVSAVVREGGVTERAAWGCVAASIAGAFSRAFHACDRGGRRRVVDASQDVVDTVCAVGGRRAATIRLDDDHARLLVDRHACCLIRLGSEGRVCASCPRLPEDRRRRRQRAAVVPTDLDLAGLSA